jgi:VWFA-related protein
MKTHATRAVQAIFISCLFSAWFAKQVTVGQEAAPAASAPTTAAVAPAPATPAGAATAPASPRPRFVPVLISVTDASGNPVAGVTKEQLTIIDTNQAVPPLKLYAGPDIPVHLGIVLVASPKTFAQQQAAAVDLVKQVIRPNKDQAFVLNAGGTKPPAQKEIAWSSTPDELIKTIQGMDENAGLPDAFSFSMENTSIAGNENPGQMTVQTYAGSGGATVFDAAFGMINADPKPARRVLVMFREPWAHSPGLGGRSNSSVDYQVRRLVGVAQQMHIAMFVIGLEDLRFNGTSDNTLGQNYVSVHGGDDKSGGSASREYDRQMERERVTAYNAGRVNVERLGTDTGGAVFWSTKKDYPDAVHAIASLLGGQYIVTFVPSDTPGQVHTLKITSSTGAKVLAQPSFFYGTGGK